MRTVLLVAAEPLEFESLLNRLSGVIHISCSLDFAASAELCGDRWLLVANGPGPQRAAEAADSVSRDRPPEVVVSTGFCGALDPQLDVGDIVVADAIGDPRGVYPTSRPRTHRSHSVGLVWSQDRVAVTVSDKKLLRQTGARAVEMEAAGLLDRASNWGSDMYCIRAVSDRAGEDLPMDFNTMRDANGRFNRARIVGGAMARPFARIPRLLRMRRNCTAAAERLGEFLADCRF